MTEKELLSLLNDDPSRGLEQTVRQYTPYVKKIVHTKLGGSCSREDIEEIISDIFVSFYKFVSGDLQEIRSVKAVLAVIARRQCADAYERTVRYPDKISIEELSEQIPDKSSQQDKEHELLKDALHRLGQPDEEIFIRKYFFGQKSRIIAREMGMKPNTVDKRISRGLIRLREIIKEEI